MALWYDGLASSVGGSLLSGFFNGIGQSATNESNLQATRETNAMNYRIWQEQLQAERSSALQQWKWQNQYYQMQKADNIDFWNMQNQYNTPSAQLGRWEDAGFSPWTLASHGNAGVATSAPSAPAGTSAPHAGTGNAPTMLPYLQQTSPITAAFQSSIDGVLALSNAMSSLIGADNDTKRVDNDTKRTNLQLKLGNQQYDFLGKRNPLELDIMNLDYLYQRDTLKSRIKFQKELSSYQEGLRVFQELKNDEQRILNDWLPAEKAVGFFQELQILSNLVFTGELTYQQALHESEKILETKANTDYIKQKKKTEEYNTSVAQSNSIIAGEDAYVASEMGKGTRELGAQGKLKTVAKNSLRLTMKQQVRDGLILDIDSEYYRKNKKSLVSKREIQDNQAIVLPYASIAIDAVNAANGYAPTHVSEFYEEYRDNHGNKKTRRTRKSKKSF